MDPFKTNLPCFTYESSESEYLANSLKDFKIYDKKIHKGSTIFAELEEKFIRVIDYLSALEKILLHKTMIFIQCIEKNTSNLRSIIVDQKISFESALTEKKFLYYNQEIIDKMLSIDLSKVNNIFNSCTTFCEKINNWFNVEIFIYNETYKPNPNPIIQTKIIPIEIPENKRTTPQVYVKNLNVLDVEKSTSSNYEMLETPQNKIKDTPGRNLNNSSNLKVNTVVNEEILVTMHNIPKKIHVIDTINFAYETKKLEGVKKCPYSPVIGLVEQRTYFFYGGIVNKKSVGSCYIVTIGKSLNFTKKRDYIPRSYAAAVKYQDFVYVFGGSNIYLGNDSGLLRDCSRYSISNDTWTAIASLDKPTLKISSSFIYNRVFIVGNEFQYGLEYVVNENKYITIFAINDLNVAHLADRWIIKRDSPELLEITEDRVKIYRMNSYWSSSRWKDLEFQSNVFKRGNYIYLVEHVLDKDPRIFRIDTFEMQFLCITGN